MIHPSPLVKVTRQEVLGHLKAAGSMDPDVLHAQKATLMQAVKFPKMVGNYVILLGALLTITILGAFLGIPALVAGWFIRRRGVRNIHTVETTFEEFLRPRNVNAA